MWRLRACRHLGVVAASGSVAALAHAKLSSNVSVAHAQEASTSSSSPAAAASNAPCAPQEGGRTPLSQTSQWLWNFEGIELRRDEATGALIYIDEATNAVLPERPDVLPSEAFSSSHRWPPFPGWPIDDAGGRPPLATQRASEGQKGGAAPTAAAGRRATRRGPARHVLLIRHAQYHVDGSEDAQRTLTELGREQAARLGERLAAIHASQHGYYGSFDLAHLRSSALTRAIETADLLALSLPHAKRTSPDPVLNEGRPCLPAPAPRRPASYDNRKGDSQRIEAAYRQLCAPPAAGQQGDSYEVVVCHANVIRYVVCRALQVAPEAWLRMSLPHSSLTHIVVRSNGDTSLRMLGDAGHLAPEQLSY